MVNSHKKILKLYDLNKDSSDYNYFRKISYGNMFKLCAININL